MLDGDTDWELGNHFLNARYVSGSVQEARVTKIT